MKVAMPCLKCLEGKSNEERRAIPLRSMPRTVGELADGGIIETRCAKGHETTYAISAPRFEVIFETGALSLLEGNHAHAVAAFTTALEAFFEFYVCEVTRRLGLDHAVYEDARGPIRLAERQLGAFLICHLLQQREPYSVRKLEELRKLRNNVVHEGYLPTRKQALDHGERALAEIHRMLIALFPRDQDLEIPLQLENNYHRALMAAMARVPERTGAVQLALMPTMVDLCAPSSWGSHPFEARLVSLERTRRDLYVVPDAEDANVGA